MKFTCSVHIKAPREKVVQFFTNSDNLEHWQEGYLGTTHLEGEPWQNGAKKEMKYKFGKGEMIITETILSNNLPDDFKGNYYHKHTENTMHSFFIDNGDNTTLYKSEIHYTRFTGIMINIMKTIMPFMFKKQVQKWIDNFKQHIESQVN